jgi:hypothetical protein
MLPKILLLDLNCKTLKIKDMLSTQYRLRLETICEKIVLQEHVSLEDMIWAEKLANANRSAAKILRQARRKAENPDMQEGDLDDFLNQLDIGGLGHERFGRSGFDSVDDIVDFFGEDRPDDWRQRD